MTDPRPSRPRASLAALLVGMSSLLMIAGLYLASLSGDVVADTIIPSMVFLSFLAVGALILVRNGSRIGLLLGLAGVLASLGFFTEEYAIYGRETRPGSLPVAEVAAWVGGWVWMPMLWALLFVVLLFPTGRLISRRWRLAAGFASLVLALVTLTFAFGPASDPRRPALENPFAIESLRAAVTRVSDSFWMYLVLLGIAIASVVTRFRRASGIERQQLKWAGLGFGASGVGMGIANLMPQGLAANAAWVLGMSAIPFSIGIAILRYRLYDIDVVIERTLVYGALTALLGAVYVGAVLGAQSLLGPLTGGNEIAVAASTLLVVALFQPLRRRVQRVVDQRFYRARYDAHRTLDAFAARLRSETDLGAVEQDLLAAVEQTVRPANVYVWLRERP